MNNIIRIFAAALTLAFAPGLPAHDTPACDALERLEKDASEHHLGFGPGFLANDGDLTFRENDRVAMRITADGELFLDGREVELTPRGQELVDAYYAGMDKAVHEFAGLGMDAAALGISAAGKAIFRLLAGQLDEAAFEQEVEAEAHKIAARANLACSYLKDVEQLEAEMLKEIPGFRPMVFRGESI